MYIDQLNEGNVAHKLAKLDQKSRQQVLRAYCHNIYTVIKGFKSTNTLFREELNTKKSKTSKPDTIVKQLPKRPLKNFVTLSTKVFIVVRMSVCE